MSLAKWRSGWDTSLAKWRSGLDRSLAKWRSGWETSLAKWRSEWNVSWRWTRLANWDVKRGGVIRHKYYRNADYDDTSNEVCITSLRHGGIIHASDQLC